MDAWLIENSTTLVVVFAWVSGVLAVVTLVLLVLWLRARRGAIKARVERSTSDRARLELEAEAAEQGQRMRMVRELHEVAARSVSGIITQAEGARFAAAQDPTAAVRSATTIEDAARAALGDLRRVATLAGEGEVDVEGQPGLADLDELVATMRDAGLGVEIRETGERHELQPGAELAVFRILQEALENALDHGGIGASAVLTIVWTDDGVNLLIEDDGIRAAAVRDGLDPNVEAQQQRYTVDDDLAALTQSLSGRGITAMRERTELFGGVFEAHTVPGVGFTVQAVFPALRHHNGVHGVPLDRR